MCFALSHTTLSIAEGGDLFSKVAIVTVIAVLPRYTAIASYIGVPLAHPTIDHLSSLSSSSYITIW
jgi:hypothetical protein